jgi:SAM-dependent methyltransferase
MATTEPASGDPTAVPAAHATDAAVAVDERVAINSGADSAYAEETESYTTSLASNITDYKFKNGRRYHAYKEGSYIFPNDERESDRLDIIHKMVEVAMGGKLHFAPIKDPKRILDIGTGTGIWAMEIGDEFPNADVVANDLSPIQPRWVPPNVHFEIDDAEADWTYSQPFDFIHCRTMAGSIKDWPKLFRQCYE